MLDQLAASPTQSNQAGGSGLRARFAVRDCDFGELQELARKVLD
jgi:hypothetical protein